MAGDYIRRDDAVKIAEKYGLANGSVLGRHTGLADCIASEISGLPAADVAEVVYGLWIKDDFLSDDVNNAEKCSQCGELIGWFGNLPNYCPNCGAKMDGGSNGE